MFKTKLEKLRNAVEFTRIYKENYEDIYLREARCIDFQLEHILVPLDEDDGLAGRFEHDWAGFTSQVGGYSALIGCNYTYYFNDFEFSKAVMELDDVLTAKEKYELASVQAYWHEEMTARKLDIAFAHRFGHVPPKGYAGAGAGNCDARIAGTNLDFDKLMRLGLDGLDAEIDRLSEKNGESSFYKALKLWIESLRKACARYRLEALALSERLGGEKAKRFAQLADALEAIRHEPPKTFLEGIQLMWIYSACSDLMNYSRMDDYLGKLYADDLDAGRITEEDGVRLVLALYKHFKEINKIHDCRVVIGGVGRKHPKEADRLAIVIMEASRRFRETVPQLTLRYYSGMSEAVWNKALDVNAEGTTFPIIYSDDTNVPAVEKVYGISHEEAEQYVPFGCGEYVIVGNSIGTPNSAVNALKALEMALHNGLDKYQNVPCGVKTGELSEFDTFEKLYAATLDQLRPIVGEVAVHKYLNYTVAGENAPYLHLSLLMNDCLERGKAIFEGGVRYFNASSELYGIISCADSLSAIKTLVYDKKRFTLEELVHILDCDFEGYEAERRLCLNAPKYGNDDDFADGMATRLFSDLADMTMAAGRAAGLNHYTIVSVNNSMSADWGTFCEASACGRHRGSPLANGNGVSAGADKSGITALLNSMSKFDHTKHVGVINNVRFTKELFNGSREKVSAVLKAFYENGGTQTNLCVIGRDDLENAMKHPEDYQNLLVRIGGFSARFVTLNPIVQREIIERTTYGA